MNLLKRLTKDESGQDILEYAFLTGFVLALGLLVLSFFGALLSRGQQLAEPVSHSMVETARSIISCFQKISSPGRHDRTPCLMFNEQKALVEQVEVFEVLLEITEKGW